MTLAFWMCAFVVAYVYLGYPLLVWLLGTRRKVRKPSQPVTWPGVTLVITAHNEEQVISEKLDNSLQRKQVHTSNITYKITHIFRPMPFSRTFYIKQF